MGEAGVDEVTVVLVMAEADAEKRSRSMRSDRNSPMTIITSYVNRNRWQQIKNERRIAMARYWHEGWESSSIHLRARRQAKKRAKAR